VTVLMKVVLEEEAPFVDVDDGPGSATNKVTTAHRLRTVDMDRVARGGVGAVTGFAWLQREGQIADEEMHRVFNCGIGMVIVVDAGDAEACITALRAAGESPCLIGAVVARPEGAPQTIVV
jgi:hypothetical protein